MAGCCRNLVEHTRSLLSWEWDDYVKSMLAVFGPDAADAVSGALDDYFGTKFDSDSIDTAPAHARQVADALGGVRPGQRLYVTEPAGESAAFAAWWPWGDGSNVSLRVGLLAPEDVDPRGLLTSWFSA